MSLNFVFWGINPEILPLGPFSIRYYGLLFAVAFYLGYIIVSKFFKKEGLDFKLLDKLLIYVALGTIIGARLGHVIFYQPAHYLSDPLEILKIWHGGLASHGAAIGIPISLYLFSRKYKQSFLGTMDKILIVTALAGFLIRSGNLMNSEIYGIPTKSTSGMVFHRSLDEALIQTKVIEDISYEKIDNAQLTVDGYVPAKMTLEFAKVNTSEERIDGFISQQIKQIIIRDGSYGEVNFYQNPESDLTYTLEQKGGRYSATIDVLCVPHHPTQIYEALSYLAIFLLLMFLYFYRFGKMLDGEIFGIYVILLFSARFFIEFIKEVQVDFENGMNLMMGQWLSIPFVLGGFVLLTYLHFKKRKA